MRDTRWLQARKMGLIILFALLPPRPSSSGADRTAAKVAARLVPGTMVFWHRYDLLNVFLIVLLVLAGSVPSMAQGRSNAMALPTQTLQVDDGLPSNQVLGLQQDARGFLWLATPEGMARYDGLEVESFGLNLPPQGKGAKHMVALSDGALQWPNGQGWLRWDGRHMYALHPDSAYWPPHTDPLDDASSEDGAPLPHPSRHTSAAQGQLMPDGRGSMLHLGQGHHGQRRENPIETLSAGMPMVHRWTHDDWTEIKPPMGRSWYAPVPMGTGEGHAWILERDPEDQRPLLVRIDAQSSRAHPLTFAPLQVPGVLEWAPGRLLYATEAGPVLLDADGRERLLLPLAAGAIRRSGASGRPAAWPEDLRHWALDSADRLWLAGDEARLYAYQLHRHPLGDSVILRALTELPLEETPTDLLVDQDGNLWWGTPNQGAGCLPASSAYVQTLTREEGLPDALVLALAAHRSKERILGNVWTGHRAGLVGVMHQTGVGGAGQPVFGSAGIRPVLDLAADALGQAWACTEEGLFRIRLRRVEKLPRMSGMRSLALSPGRGFAGGETGLFAWDIDGQMELPLPIQWHAGPVDALCSDGRGGAWAYGSALIHADAAGLVRTWPIHEMPEAPAIGLICLQREGEAGVAPGLSALVLALRGEGLWWHPGLEALGSASGPGDRNKLEASGFVPLMPQYFGDVVLRDLFAEGDSLLWVATNAGLFRLHRVQDKAYDPARPDAAWSLRRYTRGDGLPSNDLHAVLVLDGTVYLGHQRGLSLFRPEALDRVYRKPGIRLTGLQVNGADTLLDDGAQLPHHQNRIQLAYRGIAPGHGHRLRYRYRLDGLDPPGRWHSAADLSVRYAHLRPGSYRFQVEAVDADGTASIAPDTFQWTIVAPWWRSTWFILLMLVGFLMASAAGYAALLGRQHRRHLERAVSAKTLELDRKIRDLKASNEQLEQFAFIASHDLKEPLRNVANYVQWIERRGKGLLTAELEGYLDVAVRGVKRMYGMLDGLLEWSALAREGQPHRRVDGNALVQQVLQGLPGEGRLTLIGEALPDAWGDPRQLGIVLEQLVDNAIKFNPSSEVKVHIYGLSRAEEVEWCVADNGPGLDERYADRVYQIFERLVGEHDGYAGHGVGLALCRRIVERHGGRIWYRRSPDGTTFHVTLPKAP
jgi:signal transduction histidine kinase/ligand-binding sensor domain-containing protein